MKSLIIRLYLSVIGLMLPGALMAQFKVQTDPVMTGTIIAGTSSISGKLDDTNSHLNSISATNAVMTVTLDSIRSYHQIMLDGLKTVNRAFNNMFTVVDCVDKCSAIIAELNNCKIAADKNPEGALVSLVLSKNYSRILNESSSLVNNISKFVTSSSGKNLLNNAERLRILNSTHAQLCAIYSRVRNLRAQIEWYQLADIPATLMPSIYNNYDAAEIAFKRCERNIKQLESMF